MNVEKIVSLLTIYSESWRSAWAFKGLIIFSELNTKLELRPSGKNRSRAGSEFQFCSKLELFLKSQIYQNSKLRVTEVVKMGIFEIKILKGSGA